jgi:hypothetical protein
MWEAANNGVAMLNTYWMSFGFRIVVIRHMQFCVMKSYKLVTNINILSEVVTWLRRLVCRSVTPETRVRSGSVHVGFVVDIVALEQVFFPECFSFSLSISFHRCSITRKNGKTNHFCHRVAQYASRLRRIHSFCCGALHHKQRRFLTE